MPTLPTATLTFPKSVKTDALRAALFMRYAPQMVSEFMDGVKSAQGSGLATFKVIYMDGLTEKQTRRLGEIVVPHLMYLIMSQSTECHVSTMISDSKVAMMITNNRAVYDCLAKPNKTDDDMKRLWSLVNGADTSSESEPVAN